jgi:uroporphyrinogen decarboxylase
MNSRDAFRRTMQAANTGRPVFVPIVYRLAARIEQTPLLDMVSDPTSYANVLEGSWKLLNQDAIVTNFDPSLEAEIFGCQADWQDDYELPAASGWTECDPGAASLESSGRLPVLLEATRRLIQTRGREVAIIGVMTGPCSLARNVEEHAVLDKEYPFEEIISLAGGQLTKYTRNLGEAKVDAIIVREDLLAEKYYDELLAHEKAYTAVYATLFNLTRFYNVAGLLMVRGQPPENLAALSQKLGPAGLVLTGRKLGEADLTILKDLSASRNLAIGLPIPLTDRDEAGAQLQLYEDFISRFRPGGFFYTSDGEVPPDISLEAVRDITRRIKGIQES